MVPHPNRRNLGNKVFIDFDELLLLYPVMIEYADKENPQLRKVGFAVDGFTKTGLNLKSLLGEFLFIDKSGKVDACISFINDYWLNK